MAHGLQDLIVKLNGARDEQGGVGGLARHSAGLRGGDRGSDVVVDERKSFSSDE